MKSNRLDRLQPGDKGKIEEVHGEVVIKRRLLEMGLLPGAHIEIIKRAPLGDPIEVKIKGYNLSLRGHEASNIFVDVAS